VLPNLRQQFSFDTYLFPPTSGEILLATIMKAAVVSTKSPEFGLLKTPRHYFIDMPAGARAAGMFGGGGNGPDSTAAKAAPTEIGAGLAKLCWTSSISAGVICLFIFLSISRFDFGTTL
jgi:hypothetical protein